MEEKLNIIIEKLSKIEELLRLQQEINNQKTINYGEDGYGRAKFEYETKQNNCNHMSINHITGLCNVCGKNIIQISYTPS